MVNSERLLEVVPHYIVLLLLVFLSIGAVRATVGDLGLAIELAIVLVVSFAYRPIVLRLGIAPESWDAH